MVFKIKKFYITTPLYYLNNKPHIGTAYATISADVIARWHRINNEKVFFLTGTDEHGEKVKRAADEKGQNVKEFVDNLSLEFKKTWDYLNISYDDFIRTTENRHKEIVKKFIEIVEKNGDIYKGKYEGKYCIGCENYKTDSELIDGKCSDHKKSPEIRKEDTYFFRLSKYQNKILDFYKNNPDFLSPNQANEIKNRVKEGLKDVSITRINVDWGIPFPSDKNHVIYVWFDALINYVSALGDKNCSKFKDFWPADLHIIGKEINWFHSVLWPAILFSIGIEPPKKIYVNGWLLSENNKISKSLGNIINPIDIANKYSVDSLRYYLIKETPFGLDGNFSENKLIQRINGELVSDLGNLVYRAFSLIEKFDGEIKGEPSENLENQIKIISENMEKLQLSYALQNIWKIIRNTNKYINEKEPWKLSGENLGNVLYNLVERIRIIAILLSPFIPKTSEEIFNQLGLKPQKINECKMGEFKGKIKKGSYLFNKID